MNQLSDSFRVFLTLLLSSEIILSPIVGCNQAAAQIDSVRPIETPGTQYRLWQPYLPTLQGLIRNMDASWDDSALATADFNSPKGEGAKITERIIEILEMKGIEPRVFGDLSDQAKESTLEEAVSDEINRVQSQAKDLIESAGKPGDPKSLKELKKNIQSLMGDKTRLYFLKPEQMASLIRARKTFQNQSSDRDRNLLQKANETASQLDQATAAKDPVLSNQPAHRPDESTDESLMPSAQGNAEQIADKINRFVARVCRFPKRDDSKESEIYEIFSKNWSNPLIREYLSSMAREVGAEYGIELYHKEKTQKKILPQPPIPSVDPAKSIASQTPISFPRLISQEEYQSIKEKIASSREPTREDGFSQLYLLVRRLVNGKLLRNLDDDHEDALQDVAWSISRSMSSGKIETPSHLQALIFIRTKLRIANEFRRRRGQSKSGPYHFISMDEEMRSRDEEASGRVHQKITRHDVLTDTGPNPEDIFLYKESEAEREKIVAQAIKRLPPPERDLLSSLPAGASSPDLLKAIHWAGLLAIIDKINVFVKEEGRLPSQNGSTKEERALDTGLRRYRQTPLFELNLSPKVKRLLVKAGIEQESRKNAAAEAAVKISAFVAQSHRMPKARQEQSLYSLLRRYKHNPEFAGRLSEEVLRLLHAASQGPQGPAYTAAQINDFVARNKRLPKTWRVPKEERALRQQFWKHRQHNDFLAALSESAKTLVARYESSEGGKDRGMRRAARELDAFLAAHDRRMPTAESELSLYNRIRIYKNDRRFPSSLSPAGRQVLAEWLKKSAVDPEIEAAEDLNRFVERWGRPPNSTAQERGLYRQLLVYKGSQKFKSALSERALDLLEKEKPPQRILPHLLKTTAAAVLFAISLASPVFADNLADPGRSLISDESATVIVEGNIFDSKLRWQKEKAAAIAPSETSPRTDRPEAVFGAPAPRPTMDLNLKSRFRLAGTTLAGPNDSFAIVEDLASKEQNLYHLGDRLIGDVRIAEIKRNRIRVRYPGGSELLRLQLDEEIVAVPIAPSQTSASNPAKTNPPGIRQLAPDRWVVDRREVERNMNDLTQFLTQVRIIPNFINGKAAGFRIFSVLPDSFCGKIGLQAGDLLERINGMEIKDPDSFIKTFQHLKDDDHIAIDVLRNSRDYTLTYDIR